MRLLILLALWQSVRAFPEQGVWQLSFNNTNEYGGITKNLFNNTRLHIKIQCNANKQQKISVGWVLRETKCWNEYMFIDEEVDRLPTYYKSPQSFLSLDGVNFTSNWVRYLEVQVDCLDVITLDVKPVEGNSRSPSSKVIKRQTKIKPAPILTPGLTSATPIYTVEHDGDYLLVIHIQGVTPTVQFSATADVLLIGDHGYLSIVDWPLLPFYGVMCAAYVLMGIAWLVVCARHWRDLLRIQFWIGGVIFLGMLEKAMFVAEFSNINQTGLSTKGLILTAELVSCAKRTLARMLVIIVSLGFGIVKPRLGPTLHRVVGIGALYFFVASFEAWLRIVKPKNDISSATMIAGIPLAVIDSSICWWVFSALVQTTRTLRLRRNVVKLSLYRHFTNTLIFAVIASVFFMLWSIKYHRLEQCLIDWRDLWMDEAFWHLLFSVMLVIIMVLWTPSKNNQRYAFTPLLDNEEDEEEEEGLYTDAFEGMKMRNSGKSPRDSPKEEEDPLKWIEENIPESENHLPVIDSDEEIETTKFEISKMQ